MTFPARHHLEVVLAPRIGFPFHILEETVPAKAMLSLFTKLHILRGVIRCWRLHLHHPHDIAFSTYGRAYSVQLREVGSVLERLPLQTWNRFICVKVPKVPEGEPVYEPVRMPEPVSVPEPEPEPEPEDKVGGGFVDIATAVFQDLAAILSVLAVLCAISAYLKEMKGGRAKQIEEASMKFDRYMHYLLVMLDSQLKVNKQILEKMVADEKAKKESWFYKFIGYK